MTRIVKIGGRDLSLDEKSPMRLLNGLNWMEEREPDTPDNLETQKQLKDELRSRGWSIDYNIRKAKKFNICLTPQFPFNHAAKCCLPKGHIGEHFSNDRPGKLIYWP